MPELIETTEDRKLKLKKILAGLGFAIIVGGGVMLGEDWIISDNCFVNIPSDISGFNEKGCITDREYGQIIPLIIGSIKQGDKDLTRQRFFVEVAAKEFTEKGCENLIFSDEVTLPKIAEILAKNPKPREKIIEGKTLNICD